MILVPSQIVALLDSPAFSPEALSSLEMILTLGAPLHREHKERLNHLLPERFYELYGLTEGFVTVLDKHDYPRKPTSVGAPPPFFEMKIADPDGNELPAGDVGEICGRGPIWPPQPSANAGCRDRQSRDLDDDIVAERHSHGKTTSVHHRTAPGASTGS